jgi:hypothetical protein
VIHTPSDTNEEHINTGFEARAKEGKNPSNLHNNETR